MVTMRCDCDSESDRAPASFAPAWMRRSSVGSSEACHDGSRVVRLYVDDRFRSGFWETHAQEQTNENEMCADAFAEAREHTRVCVSA